MEIVVAPPSQLLWFIVGLPVLVGLALLAVRLARPVRPVHLVAPFLVACLASGGVYFIAWHPMKFSWDDAGIRDTSFGSEVRIDWADVRDARFVRNYGATDLRPVRRASGTAYATYRSGWFDLANGTRARVFLMLGEASDALLLRVGDTSYLYAPRNVEALVATARRRVAVRD